MMPKCLDNERAAFAYCKVAEFVRKGENGSKQKLSEEYRSLVRSFPAMILSNGYGTAMAFLYSKKDGTNAYGRLYYQIQSWLSQQKMFPDEKGQGIMEYIVYQKRDAYRMLANETLALLVWLKRFAEGSIQSE